MVVPLQESATQQMADVRLARLCVYAPVCVLRTGRRRQAQRESFQTAHTSVAALANGTTIARAPRLGLTRLEGF